MEVLHYCKLLVVSSVEVLPEVPLGLQIAFSEGVGCLKGEEGVSDRRFIKEEILEVIVVDLHSEGALVPKLLFQGVFEGYVDKVIDF